jgi:hypothetical protein
MKWKPIRVSKFTRNLHPEDYQPGLPAPGPLEDPNRYEQFVVRLNELGEWVGRDHATRLWLFSKPTTPVLSTNHTTSDLPTQPTDDATPEQGQAPTVDTRSLKARRKQRGKQ